jgi:hypothetical protein
VLELVHTAWDAALFAADVGTEADEALRPEIEAQHNANGPEFPGETFRVLKEKEMKAYEEYRTKRLVLEAWDKL